jgi:hypothetical protein
MIAVLFYFAGRLSNTYVEFVPCVHSTVVLAFCTKYVGRRDGGPPQAHVRISENSAW